MTQTIRRAPRRHQFLIIDQRAVEDTRLSWAARGLLAYLLSRPDNWQVRVKDLQRRGNLKRDGIYRLLDELRKARYMHYKKHRDRSGRMRGGTYIVFEVPYTDSPDTAFPDTAPPDPVKPDALPNTEINLITTTYTLPTLTHCEPVPQNDLELHFEDCVAREIRSQAPRLLAGLAPHEAQWVVDEWTGAWRANRITKSPLGYMAALAKRCHEGTLEPCHVHRSAR